MFVIFSSIFRLFIDLKITENGTSNRKFLKDSPRSQKTFFNYEGGQNILGWNPIIL